jgi:hypothetical protein
VAPVFAPDATVALALVRLLEQLPATDHPIYARELVASARRVPEAINGRVPGSTA